jgi:hypothetical protein
MSKVISFRLSRSNPREAQALDILNRKIKDGYSLRYVITEGLLALSNRTTANTENEGVLIQSKLQSILDLLKRGDLQKSESFFKQNLEANTDLLTDQFMTSLKHEVKRGLKAPS